MIHPSSTFAKAMADRPCILSPGAGRGQGLPACLSVPMYRDEGGSLGDGGCSDVGGSAIAFLSVVEPEFYPFPLVSWCLGGEMSSTFSFFFRPNARRVHAAI